MIILPFHADCDEGTENSEQSEGESISSMQ